MEILHAGRTFAMHETWGLRTGAVDREATGAFQGLCVNLYPLGGGIPLAVSWR